MKRFLILLGLLGLGTVAHAGPQLQVADGVVVQERLAVSSFTATQFLSLSSHTLSSAKFQCIHFYDTNSTNRVHISTYSEVCGGTPESCNTSEGWPLAGGGTACEDVSSNKPVYIYEASGQASTFDVHVWRKK